MLKKVHSYLPITPSPLLPPQHVFLANTIYKMQDCISEGVIVKMSLIGKCIPFYKKEGLIESNSPLYTYWGTLCNSTTNFLFFYYKERHHQNIWWIKWISINIISPFSSKTHDKNTLVTIQKYKVTSTLLLTKGKVKSTIHKLILFAWISQWHKPGMYKWKLFCGFFSERVLEAKKKIDERKRKQFDFLKDQMNTDLQVSFYHRTLNFNLQMNLVAVEQFIYMMF
jgi:hypothetical protein